MSTIVLEEERVKELFKQALVELLQERRDLLQSIFAEVLEDVALVNAIREGEATELVSREQIFRTLDGKE